ncbi:MULTISPECIES: WYL domain-containing protein [unclassified Breznakia]|uniref:helix-turn-helix transcriptional regulator n=1 Tax=unclassified Breznakia TaxID=2623764 RepID=UPI002474A494|nr:MULTISPECIES: WYL domain-containing protein [unclassified Breznakia]MDH6368027.1 putative DNA-binding transcriptional regulator YafY [Breznakia sp. PH1-1]MDH6405115.1 putative DNA-binding transcriptional regulator YafY [Breznakia sp. PF1-11]MDH6412830.1 putative DNA-binding transcriptional regulator YafY [Breznakia sp. PFB1-11]MDH6415200.1 putative DNA-binding transcriptional regulator YafY [Breznakia sp. PFB1-14]MDH6417501.1 putative DNA-binding transcriptional regulator YafY [Breznakia sp
MDQKKSIPLAILEILRSDSDDKHPLTRSQLQELLEVRYGLQAERRTLYANIQLLQEFGYDISTYEQNKKGYYLIERTFEPSEVNLICHSIHASAIIPDSESKHLIDALLKTQSKYQAKAFRERVYTTNTKKSNNREFFLNIELLLEAIQQRNRISFVYTKYNYDKKLVARREKRYELCPYELVYNNERYYLIGHNENHKGLSHYRIDKMQDVHLKQTLFDRKKDVNPYDYVANKIYMYSGDELSIRLHCDEAILDDVIDTFGTNIKIKKLDNHDFEATITSTKQGIMYWVLQYAKYCQILEPVDLREEMMFILDKALINYKGGKR